MDSIARPPHLLDAFLERHASANGATPPLAVFDCDGTVIQGDIGESMFYRQIEHFAFRVSPAEVWHDHPHRGELDTIFHMLEALHPDERRAHNAFDTFAAHLLSWYFDQLDRGSITKACADIVQLFAGFTLDEVRAFASDTWAEELRRPLGHASLGGRSLPRGARFLKESTDLVRLLQHHGFDILAISGSNTWSVEPVFADLGVPAERVIGIDLELHGEILTSRTRKPIPIQAGKVEALRHADPRSPALVASDSRNDIPLLLASTDLKVYVNSHKRKTGDFFTLGHVERDHSWLVLEELTVIKN